MQVRVVGHDPRWKGEFLAEAGRIRQLLGNELINLFHIGSTAVEGLAAKPIIDIMPVVENLRRLDAFAAGFRELGYEIMGAFGMPGRRYYRKGGDERTHQIHAFQYDNLLDVGRHLAVRDYLRAHPEARERYGRLKAGLALKFPADIEGYSDGKEDFVRELEGEALRWMHRGRE